MNSIQAIAHLVQTAQLRIIDLLSKWKASGKRSGHLLFFAGIILSTLFVMLGRFAEEPLTYEEAFLVGAIEGYMKNCNLRIVDPDVLADRNRFERRPSQQDSYLQGYQHTIGAHIAAQRIFGSKTCLTIVRTINAERVERGHPALLELVH